MHSGGVSMIRRQNLNQAIPFSSFSATRQFRVVAEMDQIRMLENRFRGRLHRAECGTDGRRINLICHDTLRFLQLFAPLSPEECFSRFATLRASRTSVACNRNGGGPPTSPIRVLSSRRSRPVQISFLRSKRKKWTMRKENAEYLVVEEFIDQNAVKMRLYKLEYR